MATVVDGAKKAATMLLRLGSWNLGVHAVAQRTTRWNAQSMRREEAGRLAASDAEWHH